MSSPHGVLRGVERKFVFSRFRAAMGLRFELPRLLAGADLSPGSTCLEIGTGYGWGSLGLARRFAPATIVATDYDGAILPLTRAWMREHQAASVVCCQADATRLPFPDSTFDLVLALYVLHHIAGYPRALDEIGRATKPGGWFLFLDGVRPPWMPRLTGPHSPDGLPSRQELLGNLEAAGFRVERWRGVWLWAVVSAQRTGDRGAR